MEYSNQDVLRFAVENGMIDIATLQVQMEMKEKEKILSEHVYAIWVGCNGRYNTYLPDETNAQGRKRVTKSTKKALEEAIVRYYKNQKPDPTVKKVFYEWIDKKLELKELQKQTYDRYERDFVRFFPIELANKKIKSLSEKELENFIRTTIHEKELTAKAWSGLRTILCGMLKYAKKENYCFINVTNFMSELDLSKRAFHKNYKPDSLNIFMEDEVKVLIEYLKEHPSLTHFAILVGLYTGMRVGEIVALKLEDIYDDFIYVHRTQIRYKDENKKDIYRIRDYPKTEAGIRNVVIVEPLKPILKQLKLMSFGNDSLFYDKKENGIKTIHSVTCALYRACDKCGIPKRSMHKLRKTFATKLINAGVEDAIITNQLGHTKILTTKQFYYFNDKTGNQIAKQINEAIGY